MNSRIKIFVFFMLIAFVFETNSVVAQSTRPENIQKNMAKDQKPNINRDDGASNKNFNSTNRTNAVKRKMSGLELRKFILQSQTETDVKVVDIIDGDTILVEDSNHQVKVRILGIDAPEIGQPRWEAAKESLKNLIDGKKITLKYSVYNLYDEEGNTLARIFAGKEDDIGFMSLRKGFAWNVEKDKYFFDEKDETANLKAEKDAKSEGLGIWQDKSPQKPWEYKKKLKN